MWFINVNRETDRFITLLDRRGWFKHKVSRNMSIEILTINDKYIRKDTKPTNEYIHLN